MTNVERQLAEDEAEISLNDIIDFFLSNWKLLLMGAISGFVIALGVAFLFGKYEAEASLINKSSMDKSSMDKSSIDYLTWKSLKRNLPILAAKISKSTEDNKSFLNVLSSEIWWQEHVVPTLGISKDDAKALSGMSKEMQEAESAKIKDFIVKVTGASKENALENLSATTTFLRSGAAYLALKDVIANYQIELLNSDSEIARNISVLEVELVYLNNRMADLELIKTRYPESSGAIISQPMDPKDSGAKYLPVIVQLIAVSRDIGIAKENLSRLNSRKSQLAIMGNYLSQAKPIIDKNFDGLSAAAELMRIEANLRKKLPSPDLNSIAILDNIKYDLTMINTRFTLGLEQPSYISTSKPHYLKPAVIGLASGLFLALLGSFCSAIWLRYRRQTL